MKNIIYLMLISVALLSCQKKWDSYLPKESVESMEELKVASSFNWKLTRELTIDSKYLQLDGVVQITSSDQKVLYYKGKADGNPITITVPSICADVMINGQSYNQMVLTKSVPLKSTGTFTYSSPQIFWQNSYYVEDAIPISNDKFLIMFTSASNLAPSVMIGTVNGNTVSYGSPVQIIGQSAVFNRIVKYDENKYIAAFVRYSGSNYYCTIAKFTVNGNTVSDIYFTNLNEICYGFEIDVLSTSQIAITWRDPSNYLYARIIGINPGPSFQIGSPITIAYLRNYNDTRFNLVALNDSKFVIGPFSNGNGDPRPYLALVQRNGTNLQLMSSQPIGTAPYFTSQVSSDILKINENRILLFYNESNRTICRFVNIVGNTFNAKEINYVNSFAAGVLNHLGACFIDQDNIHVCYTSISSSYNVTYSTASISGDIVTNNANTTTSNFRPTPLYFTEYQPIVNFMLGLDKLVIVTNNQYQNKGVVVLGTYTLPIADADHDGVPDEDDDYPNDPARAFDNYFPAAGFGSLAYEDLWPGKGDYDFNDLVVDYRFHTVTNAQNIVVDITGTFVSKASGAVLENGFGFNLPDASGRIYSGPTNYKFNTTGCRLFENIIRLNSPGDEYGQRKPTIIVQDNFFRLMPNPGTGLGVNTVEEMPFVDFDTTVIRITPTEPSFTMADFSINTWNPFIIVNKERGHEVHLPDFMPTDFADEAYFGMWEDNSQLTTGRTYKTVQNLPWAINIPSSFVWPKEKVDITQAYLKFAAWAQSGGTEFADWYSDEQGYRNDDNLYEVPE